MHELAHPKVQAVAPARPVAAPPARTSFARVVATTQELVRIPSVGGSDSAEPICAALVTKLMQAGLKPRVLTGPRGEPVGVVAEIVGARPGPTYALNAVVDTAPVGSPERWQDGDPFSGRIQGGRLYGRGAADSKVAAAIFIEVGRELARQTEAMAGRTLLFFDAAEHTGTFEGVKAFLARYPDVAGVMIGYPGDKTFYAGARGFLRSRLELAPARPGDASAIASALQALARHALPVERNDLFPLRPKLSLTAAAATASDEIASPGPLLRCTVELAGKAHHTGSSHHGGVNALLKTAAFLETLAARLPASAAPIVAGLTSGVGFSVVPDAAALDFALPLSASLPRAAALQLIDEVLAAVDEREPAGTPSRRLGLAETHGPLPVLRALGVNIDIRTTPLFGARWGRSHLAAATAVARQRVPGLAVTCTELETRPAFVLPPESPLRRAMEAAVTEDGQRLIPTGVCGPSNIGNLLAERGIEASAGYGVSAKGAHATDESIHLDSIPRAHAVYRRAIRILMGLEAPSQSASTLARTRTRTLPRTLPRTRPAA